MGGGGRERGGGKGNSLFSLCQLGGEAPSWEPSWGGAHSHSLGFIAGVGNAVGNVKSPVALPLPLGAGFFVVLSELVQARLGLGFLCSGPLGQWCGVGEGGSRDLEGPRSEPWRGSPG